MTYYTDGFTIDKNPSQVGGGFTVVDKNNNLIVRQEYRKLGFTSNEGELLGVARAACLCDPFDTIITDSQNTLRWIENGYSKTRPDLSDVCLLTSELIGAKHIELRWEPRDTNLAGIYNEIRAVPTPLLDMFNR